MKVGAILFMILGVFLILAVGAMSLLGFAMSFDAPGSEHDPAAWVNRVLIFAVPILFLFVVLVFAWIFFNKGQYVRSFWISSLFPLSIIAFVLFAVISSIVSVGKFKSYERQTAEEERLYPLQKFIRPAEGGADTILVFPGRIVAYRLYTGEEYPWAGPVGDLNKTRDTIILDFDPDSNLTREELSQFIDGDSRKLTDVYSVK